MTGLKISLIAASSLVLLFDGHAFKPSPVATGTTFIQSGMASWYGREEQGKRTASGEIFDRNKLTAASRLLPFNTVVRVTNRNNGRWVDVRITDRGPYARGRILDVSEAAAKALDMKTSGVIPVEIESLPQPNPEAVK